MFTKRRMNRIFKPDGRTLYHVFPRAAYYALREAFKLDPYAPDTDIPKIQAHFAAIDPAYAGLMARGDKAALRSDATSRVRVSGLRLEFETFAVKRPNRFGIADEVEHRPGGMPKQLG